jgi:hypothetical protein
MRAAVAIPLLFLIAAPSCAQAEPADIRPGVSADQNEARWAEWEAQARITDGDYDGAVQAEQQADAVRREAERRETLARAPKR